MIGKAKELIGTEAPAEAQNRAYMILLHNMIEKGGMSSYQQIINDEKTFEKYAYKKEPVSKKVGVLDELRNSNPKMNFRGLSLKEFLLASSLNKRNGNIFLGSSILLEDSLGENGINNYLESSWNQYSHKYSISSISEEDETTVGVAFAVVPESV